MYRFRLAALAASALLIISGSTAANAADLLEPPVIVPPPVKVGHSWYLRGHIGMSNQHLGSLYHPAMATPAFHEWLDTGNFDAAPIFGVGIGIAKGDHFRFDVVGEYRGKASFAAQDRYDDDDPPNFGNGGYGINDYTAKKSEWMVMANAYFDVGTWHGITPYVGAGVGASYNVISNYRDNNIITGGGGYAGAAGTWNLAWALHAGVGFKASENVTVDLGYSFLNLGDAQTDTVMNLGGGCSTCAPATFNDITSHDLKMSVRYSFDKGYKVPTWPTTPKVAKY